MWAGSEGMLAQENMCSYILDIAKKTSMIQLGAASQLCLLQAKTDCDLKYL